jgi:hypothetical protein
MSGSNLAVTADNGVVWEGDLGPVALQFAGPVGLRSDNAQCGLRLPREQIATARPMVEVIS